MSDTIRGKVVIAEAGGPNHPATVVQLRGDRVTDLYNAPPGEHGPVSSMTLSCPA